MISVAQLIGEVTIKGASQGKEDLQQVSEKADSAQKSLRGVKPASEEAGGSFLGGLWSNVQSAFGNVMKFGSQLGQTIFGIQQIAQTVAGAVQGLIGPAMEHQDIMEQTVKVLQSTRDASGETASAIDNLGESLSKTTFFSENTIQSGENLLLTFTNIGQNVFPQATQTLLDMSKAMGQDVKSSAIELGKALNDPEQGITALTRIGVTFSDQQKQMIKQMMAVGDTAGAQKIILGELNREFGGSADATKTAAGQWAIFQNSMDDFKQKIGTALLPILNQLMSFVSGALMPQLDRFSGWFSSTAVPALERFGGFVVQDVIPAFQNVNSWLDKFAGTANAAQPVLIALGVVIGAALVPAVWSLASGVIAATWPFLAIGAAVAGVVLIFEHFYNTNAPFKTFIDNLVNGLRLVWSDIQTNFIPTMQKAGAWLQTNVLPPLQRIGEFLASTFVPIWRSLVADWNGQVFPALQKIGTFIQANFMPAMQQIGSFLASTFRPVWQQLVQLWTDQLIPAFQQIQQAVQPLLPVLQFLGTYLGGVLVVVLGLLTGVITGLIKGLAGLLSGIVTIIGGFVQMYTGVVQIFSGIFNLIHDLFTGNWKNIEKDIRQIQQGVLNIFGGMWKEVQGIFQAAFGFILGYISGFAQGALGFFSKLWASLGHSVPDGVNSIIGFFATLPDRVFGIFNKLVSRAVSQLGNLRDQAMRLVHDIGDDFGKIFGGFGPIVQTAWNDVLGFFKGGINAAIDVINGIINNINSVASHIPGVPHIPDIPHLARGTSYFQGGQAMVGEGGEPEVVIGPHVMNLPRGSQVIPVSQYMPSGAQIVPQGQFTTQSQPQIVVMPPPIYLDGRLLANGLMPYIVNGIRHSTGNWGM